MANKHMKRCPMSHATGKMQTEAEMRHYPPGHNDQKDRLTENIKERCGEIRNLTHCCGYSHLE